MTEVAKGAFGGWGEREPGEGTHYIIEKSEYNSLEAINRKNASERIEYWNKADALEKEKSRLVDDYEYKLKQLKKQYDEAYGKQLESFRNEADYYKKLNENLLRISKERANAQRDIKPKKERSGYIITAYAERTLRVKEGDWMYDHSAWETVIQSPYPIEMDADVARKSIEKDIYPKLAELGIENTEPEDYEVAYTSSKCVGKNLLVRSNLKANFRDGLWEISLMHTKALKKFPKDLIR